MAKNLIDVIKDRKKAIDDITDVIDKDSGKKEKPKPKPKNGK